MERIAVSELPSNSPVREPLYFASGDLLIQSGEYITAPVLDAMRDAGISEVIALHDSEVPEFAFRTRHKVLSITELKPGTSLPVPVFDRRNDLLLQPDVEITQGIIDSFKRRNIFEIYTLRSPEELRLERVQAFLEKYERIKAERQAALQALEGPAFEIEFDLLKDPDLACNPQIIDRFLREDNFEAVLRPTGAPMAGRVKPRDPRQLRAADVKFAYGEKYRQITEQTAGLFERIRNSLGTDGAVLRKISSDIIRAMVADRDLLVTLTNYRDQDNYLVHHSVHVAVLAVNIATQMGLDEKQVFEVGLSALLCDIGMMMVDPAIVNKPGKLTQLERTEIDRHAVHNLSLLKSVRGIPAIVPLVIYQVHERNDRSGYPKNRPGGLIHQYARIIAVADTFDALCTARPYRDAMHPYQAMEQVIRLASTKKLDGPVVRALLGCISLFPIGCWVETDRGDRGKVVAANAATFNLPVLRLLYQDGAPAPEPETMNLATAGNVRIQTWCASPLSDDDPMFGF